MRLRPWPRVLASKQSEVSPPTHTTPPDAGSALRTPSQALRRRFDRSRSDPRLALPALPWDCASRASQRPPERPALKRPGRSAQSSGQGGRTGGCAGRLSDLPKPLFCSRAWERSSIGERTGSPAHQTPPLPVPAAVSGQGACTARQLLRPGETGESAPAGLAGVAGGGSVTPRPRARPVPAAHAPSAAPRPGPRRQPASPEGADRAPAAADSSGERGRPVTTGARGPSDAVVSMPFVGGRLNELSARTFRAPPPRSCGSYPAGARAVASGIISEASRVHLGT